MGRALVDVRTVQLGGAEQIMNIMIGRDPCSHGRREGSQGERRQRQETVNVLWWLVVCGVLVDKCHESYSKLNNAQQISMDTIKHAMQELS